MGTPAHGFQTWIGLNLVEDFHLYRTGAFFQVVENLLHVTQGLNNFVGNDKYPGDVLHLLKILEGVGLEVDLTRQFEPLHINSALGHALDVNQVDGGNVGRGTVATVGTATESQRWHVGVVDITNSSVGAG